MGKIAGLSGTLSGKIGTMVFTKGEDGVSYAKSYQPQVANPRTRAQLVQRAKMNLAGRISALVPKRILALGEVSSRRNRSAFNKSLLGLIKVDTSDPSIYQARIDPADIVFAKGAEVSHATVSTPTVTSRQFTMQLSLMDAELSNRYGERIVVMVTTTKEKGGISGVAHADVLLTNTTAQNVTIELPFEIADGDMVTVSRSPFILSQEGAGIVTTGVFNNTTDALASILKNPRNVRGWGFTLPVMKSVFTQA